MSYKFGVSYYLLDGSIVVEYFSEPGQRNAMYSSRVAELSNGFVVLKEVEHRFNGGKVAKIAEMTLLTDKVIFVTPMTLTKD